MSQHRKESGDTVHRYGSGHLLDDMVGCSDMVLLDPITTDNLVDNLRKRYQAGEIYVGDLCTKYASYILVDRERFCNPTNCRKASL